MTENEVLTAFDELYEQACLARDAVAAAAPFVDDPDVTFWGSEEAEQALGHDAVRKLLAGVTASPATLAFRWASGASAASATSRGSTPPGRSR